MGLIPCTLFGLLIDEDKEAYYVCSWRTDSDAPDHNWDCHSIIKKAVTKITRLAEYLAP